MATVSEQVGPDDRVHLICSELAEVSLPPSPTWGCFFLPPTPAPEVPHGVGDR